MRTLVRNRRRERRTLPQMEARRRKRRAANVNRRRWVDKAAYFLEQAQEIGDWLHLFGHLKLGEPGVSPQIAARVQAERSRQDRMVVRADEALAKAQEWEAKSPL